MHRYYICLLLGAGEIVKFAVSDCCPRHYICDLKHGSPIDKDTIGIRTHDGALKLKAGFSRRQVSDILS